MERTEPKQFGLCEYCRRGSGEHLPGCPNYEPPVLCVCEICNENVIQGEKYIIYHSHTFHSDCFLEKYEKDE